MSYVKTHLPDVDDSAARYGLGDVQEARFAMKALDAQDTGLAHIRVRPGRRQPFAHRHAAAEEVYVVLPVAAGSGLDDEIIDVRALDAIRIAPAVTRQFEAGPDGLEYSRSARTARATPR